MSRYIGLDAKPVPGWSPPSRYHAQGRKVLPMELVKDRRNPLLITARTYLHQSTGANAKRLLTFYSLPPASWLTKADLISVATLAKAAHGPLRVRWWPSAVDMHIQNVTILWFFHNLIRRSYSLESVSPTLLPREGHQVSRPPDNAASFGTVSEPHQPITS